jgi:hypothetical protein
MPQINPQHANDGLHRNADKSPRPVKPGVDNFPSVIVNFWNNLFRIVLGVSRKKSYLETVRQPKYWSGNLRIKGAK